MKINKTYLNREIKKIIKEQIELEAISSELSKTSVIDPELFKDPTVVMERFNTIFEVVGVIFDNQMLLKEKIADLEEKINSLEVSWLLSY